MRFPHFFIDRPIFASVIAVVFVILGAVSYGRLPIAEYPGDRAADNQCDGTICRG